MTAKAKSKAPRVYTVGAEPQQLPQLHDYFPLLFFLTMTTSYVTQATQWPSAATVPDDVQKLIALFYETADSKDPGAGLVLAKKVFSQNASLVSASGAFNGFDGASPPRLPLNYPKNVARTRNFLFWLPSRCPCHVP